MERAILVQMVARKEDAKALSAEVRSDLMVTPFHPEFLPSSAFEDAMAAQPVVHVHFQLVAKYS